MQNILLLSTQKTLEKFNVKLNSDLELINVEDKDFQEKIKSIKRNDLVIVLGDFELDLASDFVVNINVKESDSSTILIPDLETGIEAANAIIDTLKLPSFIGVFGEDVKVVLSNGLFKVILSPNDSDLERAYEGILVVYVNKEKGVSGIIEKIEDFKLKKNKSRRLIISAPISEGEEKTILIFSEGDRLYEEAKNAVVKMERVSVSSLQKELGVEYARAAELMNLLEENGVVGPVTGVAPRKVLKTN